MNIINQISEGQLWFFIASRKLTSNEKNVISSSLYEFFSIWTAHGAKVYAQHEIVEDQIIVIGADSTKSDITGCSKDKLQHIMIRLQQELDLDLFQRMLIPIFHKGELKLMHWNDLQDRIDQYGSDKNSFYWDTSISDIQSFRTHGEKPIKELFVLS